MYLFKCNLFYFKIIKKYSPFHIEFFYDLINLIILFILTLFRYMFTFSLIATFSYCHELLNDSLK